MNEISIFVADDHEMFRSGIIGLIKNESGLDVIGEGAGITEIRKSGILGDADILLLDLSLGEDSGLDLVPELRSKYPALKILILSMHNKPVLIKKAVNAGISGYVVKNSPPDILIDAINRISKGRNYFDPNLSDSLFMILNDSSDSNEGNSLYTSLSRREQEIFRLLAEGFNTHQIAKTLFISKKTVDNHRLNVMGKLKLKSLPELISLAGELGVIKV